MAQSICKVEQCDRRAESKAMCAMHYKRGPRSSKIPRHHIIFNVGKTCQWRPPFVPKAVECAWCGQEMTTSTSRNRFCSPRCNAKFKKAKRRGAEHNAIGTYSWAEIVRLWLTFGKACAYCSRPVGINDIQAEHVVPLSRGGANNLTNLLPSCGPCNSDKRDLLLDEWNADRERRLLPPVKTDWQASDAKYAHLVTAGRRVAA